MELLFDFFQFRDWQEVLIRGLIFLLSSTLFVWIVAFILARAKTIIKKDVELKVYFGSLLALVFYILLFEVYLLLVAAHNWGADDYFWITIPQLAVVYLVAVLALSLSNKIRIKLSLLKEKRR